MRLRTLLLSLVSAAKVETKKYLHAGWTGSCGFDDACSDDRVGMDVNMTLAGLTVTAAYRIRHVARQQLDSCGR